MITKTMLNANELDYRVDILNVNYKKIKKFSKKLKINSYN